MSKLIPVDLDRLPEIYKELATFAQELKAKLPVEEVWLFGSFATGQVHEGSDIDLLLVGAFPERFHYRALRVRELTDLPIEPFCYTREEFEEMKERGNPFILEVLRTGRRL